MLRNVGVVLVKFVIIDLFVFLLILPCVRSLFVFLMLFSIRLVHSFILCLFICI